MAAIIAATGLVALLSSLALASPAPAQAALITVNSTSDTALNGDGLCTLREAASSADFNSSSGGDCTAGDASSLDTIQLGANTYDISVGLHFMNTSDTGGVKIAGTGMSATTIHGKPTFTDSLVTTQAGSALTLEDLKLDGANASSGFGGAVEGITNSLTLNRVRITNSTGILAGGAVYFQPDTTTYPSAVLTITDSVIDHNTATSSAFTQAYGGGIATQGKTVITGTAITDNTALNAQADSDGFGGGIRSEFTSDLTLVDDLIANNIVNVTRNASGGGVMAGGPLTAVNVTLTNNSLSGAGTHAGRAITKQSSSAALTNVTISGNTNPIDGAAALTGPFSLRSSIVDEGALGCAAPVTTLGGNVDRGTSCWASNASGDAQTTDPMLGTLASNGGPTQTMALPTGSAAIDRVPTASCVDQQTIPQPVSTDQRGVARPQGTACDSGSFEVVVPIPPAAPAATPPPTAAQPTCKGKPATIVGTAGPDVLTGTPGPDVISGLGDNDRISGLDGGDVICGNEGNDVLTGARGADTLIGGSGDDKLNGGAAKDKLNGQAGNDVLKGGPARDVLKGGPGKDFLLGQGGSDLLVGQGGNDACFGGGGGSDRGKSCERLKGI